MLIVVKAEGNAITENELLAFYEGKVAKWQIPGAVNFVQSLPLGATGKVLKKRLSAEFSEYQLRRLNGSAVQSVLD